MKFAGRLKALARQVEDRGAVCFRCKKTHVPRGVLEFGQRDPQRGAEAHFWVTYYAALPDEPDRPLQWHGGACPWCECAECCAPTLAAWPAAFAAHWQRLGDAADALRAASHAEWEAREVERRAEVLRHLAANEAARERVQQAEREQREAAREARAATDERDAPARDSAEKSQTPARPESPRAARKPAPRAGDTSSGIEALTIRPDSEWTRMSRELDRW